MKKEIENWSCVELKESGTHKLIEKLFKEDWTEEYGADFEFDEIEYHRFTWTHINCEHHAIVTDLLTVDEAEQFFDSMKDIYSKNKKSLYLVLTK